MNQTAIVTGYGFSIPKDINPYILQEFAKKHIYTLPPILFDALKDTTLFLQTAETIPCQLTGTAGIPAFIANIITNETNINMGFFERPDDEPDYILFTKDYGWKFNLKECNLNSEDELLDILRPYIEELGLNQQGDEYVLEYND